MDPERLGSLYQTRHSFSRALIRKMVRERWQIRCAAFDVSPENIGEAIYTVRTVDGLYTFVVFAHRIADEERTDRAIAEQWDYTCALVSGELDAELLAMLRTQVPVQDRGQYTSRVLVFSRANKSGRLFDLVVDRLANGSQPPPEWFDEIGYLLRTTAVYANGLNGIADFEVFRRHPALNATFAAQMLTVYLVREFSLDLADHLAARRRPGSAAGLSPALRRHCGVGNATGLGMVPFLVNHPVLLDRWMYLREAALAQVLAQPVASKETAGRFQRLLDRCIAHIVSWRTEDVGQSERLTRSADELRALARRLRSDDALRWHRAKRPWLGLHRYVATHCSRETREIVASLMVEPHGRLTDWVDSETVQCQECLFAPHAPLSALRTVIERRFRWAIESGADGAGGPDYFWYRSSQKAEPRLGVVGEDDGEDRALAMGVASDVRKLHAVLAAMPSPGLEDSVAGFLARWPQHRHAVRRVLIAARHPYSEIRTDLLHRSLSPVGLLRAKLAMFGATRFDPKSERWLRITLMQGAPPRDALDQPMDEADDWLFPVYGEPA